MVASPKQGSMAKVEGDLRSGMDGHRLKEERKFFIAFYK